MQITAEIKQTYDLILSITFYGVSLIIPCGFTRKLHHSQFTDLISSLKHNGKGMWVECEQPFLSGECCVTSRKTAAKETRSLMDVNLKTHITHQSRNGLRHQKEDIKYNKTMKYVDLLWKYQSIFPFFPHTNLIKLLCYHILQKESHFFIQSERPNPIATCLHSFSCTLHQLHVVTTSFDWFTVLFIAWGTDWLEWLLWFWVYDTQSKTAQV